MCDFGDTTNERVDLGQIFSELSPHALELGLWPVRQVTSCSAAGIYNGANTAPHTNQINLCSPSMQAQSFQKERPLRFRLRGSSNLCEILREAALMIFNLTSSSPMHCVKQIGNCI